MEVDAELQSFVKQSNNPLHTIFSRFYSCAYMDMYGRHLSVEWGERSTWRPCRLQNTYLKILIVNDEFDFC